MCVCVCRLLQIMCTCPLSALLHFVFWFALRVSLCAYFLFHFVASLLRLQCWGFFCVGSAIKCIIYMHSSDLVATANFTAHSTGTAQHLPFLPTCACVRKRESVRNTLLTLCKSFVWGLPTATSHNPLSYLKISKLQPCDSVVKWTTACEPNYPNYANLKIHIKIFVSYKTKAKWADVTDNVDVNVNVHVNCIRIRVFSDWQRKRNRKLVPKTTMQH